MNILRKIIVPIFVAASVATATYFFQAFTLLREEGMGLFLNTPDFYRTLFLGPLPISHIFGSFLVQFYSNYRIGIAIVTAMVLCTYFIGLGIFRRMGFKNQVFPVTACCISWWFMANADSPTTGVAIILLSGVFLIMLSLFRKVPSVCTEFPGWLDGTLSFTILAVGVCMIGTGQKIRETEKWGRIEFAAIHDNWDFVLKYATPQEAVKNVEVVPWAFLALNVQGRLLSEYRRYPVASDFGLDYGHIFTYRSCLFYSILYKKLGCYNEVIHRTYQSGDYLPHGTSFRTLRMLIQCNYELQDYQMVVKYCDVLQRSTLHDAFVKYYKNHPCPRRHDYAYDNESETRHIVYTKNQADMLQQLYRAGMFSPMAEERMQCYLKLYGKNE